MPLTRASDIYTSGADGVRFLMQDGPFEIVCQIDLETLSQLVSTVESVEANAIFEYRRMEIERAASVKYDLTSRRDYEVLTVSATDLDPATASRRPRPGRLK